MGNHHRHNCHLYRVNAVEDHIHIATHLHPTVALATLVEDVKTATTTHMKENRLFQNFPGW
ncbi:transposase [Segetibacter sp. 3557_3]|uniref:transposase n=1 Tax=Segetibacter sp. 3557_3 TaxID=2547429 RepID=UPI001A9FF2C7